MKPHGHWWCERCQDVVFLRADETEPARCSACGRDSAVFIPDKPAPMNEEPPVSAETAKTRLAELRQTVAAIPAAS